MKFNLKSKSRQRRLKNEALDLRANLIRNSNYNIFVDDRRYKTNFWLQFEKSCSEDKFRKTIYNRTRNILRGVIILLLTVLFFIYLTGFILSIGLTTISMVAISFALLFSFEKQIIYKILFIGFFPNCLVTLMLFTPLLNEGRME